MTFSATITNLRGDGPPTGTVEFFDGNIDLGAGGTLSGSGSAATSTLTTSIFAASGTPHAIKAVYRPAGPFATSNGSVSQTINPATLTVALIGNPNKTYDGTTAATLTPVNYQLSGLANGDTFTVTAASGTYNSKDVLVATTVSVNLASTDFTPGPGTLASNYVLPTSAGGPGQINPATLIISAAGDSKTYDGTSTSSKTPTVTGAIYNNEVTYAQAFVSAHALGTGKSVLAVSFTTNDGNGGKDYSVTTDTASGTISAAAASYQIGNDTQAHGYPANLAADLPGTFPTGVNGETLHIAYHSAGDTSTAAVGSYQITGMVSNGTGLVSDYNVTVINGILTVLGSGVGVVGTELWLIGGAYTNDQIAINPAGPSTTGSSGVRVQATLNGAQTAKTYPQSFTALRFFGYTGNDFIAAITTLTVPMIVNAGAGNDYVQLDNAAGSVTLGNGIDTVLGGDAVYTIALGGGPDYVRLGNGRSTITAGNGNNTITLGDGNDSITLGNGNNVLTTGNGLDKITAGDGNNTITLGTGRDTVRLGNGSNVVSAANASLIVAGNGNNLIAGGGHATISVGNGANLLMDGTVQLTRPGDTLTMILSEWVQQGKNAASDIRSRLTVKYNTAYSNSLHAGTGLDWFWATDAQDYLNAKSTDLRN